MVVAGSVARCGSALSCHRVEEDDLDDWKSDVSVTYVSFIKTTTVDTNYTYPTKLMTFSACVITKGCLYSDYMEL